MSNDHSTLKICHVIVGLSQGGAEKLLLDLVTAQSHGHQILVISLTTLGNIGRKIEARGVPVIALGMRKSLSGLLVPFKLYELLRKNQPDLVQTWMYHADLIGGLAAKMAKIPVIWGIHHADPLANSHTTRNVATVCAMLSRQIPARIIACSPSAQATHQKFGYAADNMTVISNGINVDYFAPHSVDKAAVLKSIDLEPDSLVVGHVARWHPIKDHATFLRAAQKAHRALGSHVKFVLAGPQIEENNPTLRRLIDELGLSNCTRMLGQCDDVVPLMSSFDVFVSSSLNESFALVVAEAMSCEVPCIVTDIGMSSHIVGDTGLVVPPQDANALADAIVTMLRSAPTDRKNLGIQARKRIIEQYSVENMISRYNQLYREIHQNSGHHKDWR